MAGDQKYFFLNLLPALIHGASPKANHLDWFELDNWDFSMNQTADANVKGGRPSKTSAVGRFGFSIVHNGPYLFQLAASGQFIGETTPITFEAERSGLTTGGGATGTGVYFQLIFKKVVVSHRSLSGDDGLKMEHIELVFEHVSMMYKQVVNGVLGSANTKTYDAKSNQVR
jgi:type VI protein secretion system component Hcp